MKRVVALCLLAVLVVVVARRFSNKVVAENTTNQDVYARFFAIQPIRETRAVWLTTFLNLDWPMTVGVGEMAETKQKQQLCNLLDSLQNAGINTVLFQTRLRGTVIYRSEIEPFDRCMTGRMGVAPSYDPLQFAVDECHKRGMELHAWVVAMKVDRHLANVRGIRVLHHNIGSGYVDWLDPASTSTDDYLSSIVTEIVSRYDVDGINLDYMRYPENARALRDGREYARANSGLSRDDWRRANITRIVARLYHDIKAIKPWVKVTSSPVGRYADLRNYSSGGWNAREAVYQDAQAWMRDDIHDGVFPMMYYRGDYFYPFAQDWQENSNAKCVAPGLGIYFLAPNERNGNWPLETITDELRFMRQNGMGQCFFRARYLIDNTKGIYDWLVDFNRDKALPVALSCASLDVPERVCDVEVTYYSLDHVRITWSRPAGSDLRYNIYLIDDDAVATEPVVELLASLFSENSYDLNARYLLNKPYKIGVRAMNRYGVESEMQIVDFETNRN